MNSHQSQQSRLQAALEDYPPPEQHDYLLYTDGSGFDDGFAGSACVIIDQQKGASPIPVFRVLAAFGLDTLRAEFQAVLLGLDAIQHRHGSPRLGREPKVQWMTDRLDLATQAAHEPPYTGKPLAERSSHKDLWASYKWFETQLLITPVFTRRNTQKWQELADRLSSECRVLMKEHVQALRQQNVIP